MSPKRPVANDASSLVTEAMQGIVAEVENKTKRDDAAAAAEDRRERTKRFLAIVLLPTALTLSALNLTGMLRIDPAVAEPAPAVVLEHALALLSDAADELETFHAANGHYPARPAFLGPADAEDELEFPFSYQLIGQDRYTISLIIDGQTVTYDSLKDADTFFAEVR